jgi:hypothetical protein
MPTIIEHLVVFGQLFGSLGIQEVDKPWCGSVKRET